MTSMTPAPTGTQCGHAQPQGFASCTRTHGHSGPHRCEGTPWRWNQVQTRCIATAMVRGNTVQCMGEWGHGEHHHAAGWVWATEERVIWMREETP